MAVLKVTVFMAVISVMFYSSHAYPFNRENMMMQERKNEETALIGIKELVKDVIAEIMQEPADTGDCLKTLYVMAFTSDLKYSEIHDSKQHAIQVQLVSGALQEVDLYNRPGDDAQADKGDLWELQFSKFNFKQDCIRRSNILTVAVTESSDDAWHIESIVTFTKNRNDEVQLLTQDLDANRWISDAKQEQKQFVLTLVE